MGKTIWMNVSCASCGKQVFSFKAGDSISLGLFEMITNHLRTEHQA
jgi:hypothetical protein